MNENREIKETKISKLSDLESQENLEKQKKAETKRAWSALFSKAKTTATKKQPTTTQAKEPIQTDLGSESLTLDLSTNSDSEATVESSAKKRRHTQGHAIGWDDGYLEHKELSSWIAFESDTCQVKCNLCIKHGIKPPAFGKGKENNFITGLNASMVRLDALLRHGKGSGHCKAVALKATLGNTKQNLESVVKN